MLIHNELRGIQKFQYSEPVKILLIHILKIDNVWIEFSGGKAIF